MSLRNLPPKEAIVALIWKVITAGDQSGKSSHRRENGECHAIGKVNNFQNYMVVEL